MKRRNVTCEGKLRRPVKKNKIAENFYGRLELIMRLWNLIMRPKQTSKTHKNYHNIVLHRFIQEWGMEISITLVYIKLLLLWGLVLVADYFLEFRFEYLWPFWLFLRSVYDSLKYQGLAFSVFFICIALTSDMICFLFIPIHWLFFAASTYVWVQYVWHTEKGVCLPTVFLWLLFVYIEASIRLKEFKAHTDLRNLPFHMDLCRPFAAHCIGYPVVTLGFGFKSYIGYRMRRRRRKEVQKENEYYFGFLREALPPGQAREEAFNPQPSPKPCHEDRISSDSSAVPGSVILTNGTSPSSTPLLPWSNGESRKQPDKGSSESLNDLPAQNGRGGMAVTAKHTKVNGDAEYMEKMRDDASGDGVEKRKANASVTRDSSKRGRDPAKQLTKEEIAGKLESDLKRLKIDLQISKNKENELRDQIISYMSSERFLKSEISNLQVEKSVLESRISALHSTRASEKAALSTLEKKLADERKQKAEFQIKLEAERKLKKDSVKAEMTAQQNQNQVIKLEAELKAMRMELQTSHERCQKVEQDLYVLRKFQETHGDPEVLVQALKTMKERNSQLEKSLSSETKVKMDLFSALGEAKRELGIRQGLMNQKDTEIQELKTKIAEVLAVMPTSSAPGGSTTTTPRSTSGGISSFSTLSLDLPPPSTDLSFNKLSGLGLMDLEDKLTGGGLDTGALGSFGSLTGSTYSPKTNGSVNDI